MPRHCKICHEEFPSASKLAEHLKFSNCSNYRTIVKCPYCHRDDFVDEDSLNRHLSHNRQCSRADMDATDKLSMLLPDPSYTSLTQPKWAHTGQSPRPLVMFPTSDMDSFNQHQGNLVNFVNSFNVNHLHQIQTSLHGHVTKVFQQGQEITIVIYNNDPSTTIHKELAKEQQLNSQQEEVVVILEDNNMVLPLEEFDTGADEGYEEDNESTANSSEDEEDPDARNDVEGIGNPENAEEPEAVVQTTNNPAIDHRFTGGSPELDSLVELYSMLDRRGVANTLFDKITKWAWLNANTFGNTPPMKREVVVQKVFRAVRGDNYKEYMYPKQTVLKLSTGRHVALTYFPLESMIIDLLINTTLMEKQNLLFADFSDPTKDNSCNDPLNFGELNTGTWWKTAMEHECTGERDVLWPLIMFIDGMKVDNISGKLKLEPISFTFSRFKRFVRHQDNAWRTWAYMEDIKQPTRCRPVGEEDPMLTSKQRLQEYHDILHFLMKQLRKVQQHGMKWTFNFGQSGRHDVVLKLPLQFIIGDCEGHDKLAGRFKGHTHNIKGLCRDCDVPTQFGDDENWGCSYFIQREMEVLTEEELRQKSFHKIRNGLHGVSIGGCPRGIFGMLIPEMLHLYKSGHCDWQSDSFVYSLSQKSIEVTTQVCAFLVNANRGQSNRSYPDIGTFRDGIIKSQGTNLMGHQKHARIFFIYLMLCCSEFVRSLDYNHKRGSQYDKHFYEEYADMLEHSLGFYEWSMKREHEPDTIVGHDGTPETSKAQQSIRRYLMKVKRCCLRSEMGKSYKMPKFHQSLHLVSAVERHGSLVNVDGSRPESMAKGNVKDPASHTQRISSKLSYQTGKRYIESLTFREYKRLRKETDPFANFCCEEDAPYINSNTKEAKIARGQSMTETSWDEESPDIDTKGSTKFSICLDVDQPEGQYAVTIEWLGKGNKPLKSFDNHLVQQLGKRLFGALDGGIVADTEVPGCTSVIVHGNKYTAHPMFGNDHVWLDWVYIKWDGYEEPIPARIEMFIDLTGAEILNGNPSLGIEHTPDGDVNFLQHFNHEFLENKVYAVVWSAKSLTIPRHKITEYHIPLKLGFRIELEPGRRIVPVESFVKPCYGMLNSCGIEQQFDMTAIVLKDTANWADFFLA